MTYTRAIGLSANKVIRLLVRGLALSRINPNVLTFLGLLINILAAAFLASGNFRTAGIVIIFAGLFDMVDGRVARETNQVTRFGGSSTRFWIGTQIWLCWSDCLSTTDRSIGRPM